MNEYKVTYHDEFSIKLSTIVDAVTVDAAIARVRYMYDDLRMILDVEEVTLNRNA